MADSVRRPERDLGRHQWLMTQPNRSGCQALVFRPWLWFRFNRGVREDVYEAEAVNYERVAGATGVKVPEVVAIDRSRSLAPTSYLVLEFLTGEGDAA